MSELHPVRGATRRQKAALWARSGGLCESCGDEIRGDWHADHVEAWSRGGQTSIGNLRVTCIPCNLKKGAKAMKLKRSHQVAAERLAREIVGGTIIKKSTVAAVTPGGGKSLLAAIFSKVLLDAHHVYRVVWVCPRTSLQHQAADGFKDVDFNPKYQIRLADNIPPMVRDQELGGVGYATTYQAIAANPDVHAHAIGETPTLVILDEPHHVSDDGSWAKSIVPVVQRAKHVLLMTGTIERNDRAAIPFIEYEDGKPIADIRYTRRDALREGAVLPMTFTYRKGWARFTQGGSERRVDISTASPEEVSRVVATFISDESFRNEIADNCLREWLEYRRRVYRSRAIIICERQDHARAMAEYVRKEYSVQVALAVSEDADAQRTIRQFREGKRGEVLVTVGMAYEGLDVPDCTHLAYLRVVRSVPWIDQAFNRVTRFNRKCGKSYDDQKAYIYAPDDPSMQNVIESLKAEQELGLKDRAEAREGTGGDRPKSDFVPLGAEAGGVAFGTLDARIDGDAAALVDSIKQQVPAAQTLSAEDILAIRGLEVQQPEKSTAKPLDERELRAEITALTNQCDRLYCWDYGETNKRCVRRFNKSRAAMGVLELQEVVEYVTGLIKQYNESAA